MNKLLTLGQAVTKIMKGDKADVGFKSAIQYLQPHTLSGTNLCPSASQGCSSACLFTAGRGRFINVSKARKERTQLFLNDRLAYEKQLRKELTTFVKRCEKTNDVASIRLNGTSDIQWEKMFPSLFDDYPHVQFYDYTKIHKRMLRFCNAELPVNYHLTFSRSETNEDKCKEVLKEGGNIAVVWANPKDELYGYPTFSMDETDLRFLDPNNHVGYLTAKGAAKKDTSGFVIRG